MAQVVQISQPGGVELLRLTQQEVGAPAAGEVRLRQTAVGINFIDIYHRTGLYALPSYPSGIGLEAAGVVEAVGEGVTRLQPGDRVAYCGGGVGAYAAERLMQESRLVKLPEGISDEVAAACMLKGLTAHYLLRLTYPVRKGDTILIHAAAGGVGLLVCQWAKHLGATVIGTVGSEEKAELARANGCDHAILYRKEDFAARVKALTGGEGVDVVYDSVGADTFLKSLDCIKKFGMLVSFGQSSGAVPPFDPGILSQKGSLYLTRPILMHHIENPDDYQKNAEEMLQMVANGVLKIHIGDRYPLIDAKQAQRDLESRATTGALVLIP